MATYILLASFTDQGIRHIKDSPKRADAFKNMAKKCGATVKDVFWTLGEYDIVAVVEAPDDISITALGLSTGALGNIRTQTLRAFKQADMKTIISRMASDPTTDVVYGDPTTGVVYASDPTTGGRARGGGIRSKK